MEKSTIEEIRERFDNDVERFSNLETGQATIIDAALSLELITEATKRLVPDAENLLDVGCGAGNFTLKMLSKKGDLNCTLVDLSGRMLDKAYERVSKITDKVQTIQGDIRTVGIKENHFDIILAGAVLHHLRDDNDWETTFGKLYRLLKPGGCLMISDTVVQDNDIITAYLWERYEDYLKGFYGEEKLQNLRDYIEKEDSPRTLTYQLELMKKVGFRSVEVLHKNLCIATFGGIK